MWFFVLAIFFLPFDSFPIFPVSSTYRPISVLCLLVCFVIRVFDGKLRKADLIIAVLTLIMGTHAVFGAYWYFGEYSHLLKTFITLILFFVIIASLNNILLALIRKHGIDYTLNFITKIFIVSLSFLCIIGAIQFLASIGIIPNSVSRSVTLLFTYRMSDSGRLQLVSGEPSMLVRNLLTILPFLYFYYFGKFKRLFYVAIASFLILSGSTYGYLIIVFFAVFHLVFFHLTVKNIRKVLLAGTFFILVLVGSYQNFLPDYTKKKLDRVVQFTSDPRNIETIISVDGSIFQRVVNPYIGFVSGEYSSFLGIGLDNFRYVYPEYVLRLFPFAARYGAVKDVISGENYITPKSFYARVFSELGLIPFLMYMLFLLYLYIKIRQIKRDKSLYSFVSICFTLSVVIMISWDSLIYFNLLFLQVLIVLILKFQKSPTPINAAEETALK